MPNLPSRRRIESFVKPFRVTDGKKFKLKQIDPDDTGGLKSKEEAAKLLATGVQRLAELQDKLYAQDRWSLLLVFQAMDAAGKDGTIKHVMSGVNPPGCQVFSFKAPSSEELDHDFMWRSLRCLPERGRIGIFNRSYYEEMLVVRVHPELLHGQKLPPQLVTDDIWKERFEDVRNIERYLARNGVVDPEVLPARVEGRAEEAVPRAPAAAGEELEVLDGRRQGAELLGRLQHAYEDMIQHTASERRAVVRRARRPQVVHAAGRRRRDHRRARGPGAAAIPTVDDAQARGTAAGAGRARAERRRQEKDKAKDSRKSPAAKPEGQNARRPRARSEGEDGARVLESPEGRQRPRSHASRRRRGGACPRWPTCPSTRWSGQPAAGVQPNSGSSLCEIFHEVRRSGDANVRLRRPAVAHPVRADDHVPLPLPAAVDRPGRASWSSWRGRTSAPATSAVAPDGALLDPRLRRSTSPSASPPAS